MAHVLERDNSEEQASPRTIFEDRERDYVKLTPRRRTRPYGINDENGQMKRWNIFQYGVRAPVLADIRDNKSFTCRFDKVQSAHKISESSPVETNRCRNSSKEETTGVALGSKNRDTTLRLTYTNGDYPDEDKSDLKSFGRSVCKKERQNSDVRDVMYRNTFYPDEVNLRYRISNLPRIPTVRRSADCRTSVATDESSLSEQGSNVTVSLDRAALQKYSRLSLDRLQFNAVHKYPATPACREIGKLNSCLQPVSVNRLGGSVRPIAKQPSGENNRNQKDENKNGRPLKSENVRYRPFNMAVKLPSAVQFSPVSNGKNFKSAEAYRDYIQKRLKESSNLSKMGGTTARQNTTLSQYNFESNILNSVISVNRPATVGKPPASPTNSNDEDPSDKVMPEWVNIEKSELELL